MASASQLMFLDGGGARPAADLWFANNRYGFGPNTYGTPDSIAGWSYTGSVSGTGATVRTAETSGGAILTFANGVPRITDLGLADEAAYTEAWGVLNTDTPANQWGNATNATLAVGVIPARLAGVPTVKFTTTAPNGLVQHNKSIGATDSATRVFAVDIQRQNVNYTVVAAVVGGTTVQASLQFSGATGAITSGLGTVVAKDANWWRVAVPVTNNNSIGNTLGVCSVTIGGAGAQAAEVALPNFGIAAGEVTYLPPGTAAVTRTADAASLTYSPNGSSGTVLYATNGSASVSPTSPINLGASSGGAWVGSYVRRLTVAP